MNSTDPKNPVDPTATLRQQPEAADDVFGYALGMRVLQSSLYVHLDDCQRAECDALIHKRAALAISNVTDDEVIELAEAMQVRRILEEIKKVAALHLTDELPTPFQAAWVTCCEEIFYRATGEEWHMDEDGPQAWAARRLKNLTTPAANDAALASRAPAQALGGEALREVLAPFVHDENYIEGRFGIIDDDDDTVESASSFEQAIELWRECSAREPNERFSITGWNHATLVYGHDVERLFGPLKGTFDCPICGKAEPHEHSGAEVADQRRHEQWMQKNNEEKRQEILRRVASVNEKYGQRPNLDAAVSAVAALASRAPAQALGREPKRFALLWKEITSRWYAVSKAKTDSKLAAFDEGVRFAEAHHFGDKLENRPEAAYETQPDGSIIAVDPAALAHRATAQAPELGAIVNAADAAGIPVQLAVGQEGVSIDALRKFAALACRPSCRPHLHSRQPFREADMGLTAVQFQGYIAPHIQWNHIDGPLLHVTDASLYWLRWRDRIALALGLLTVNELNALVVCKLRRQL